MTLVSCPYCTDGTFTDANGARWKCFYCQGRRVVATNDADGYDRASDECAESYFETGEHLDGCPHARSRYPRLDVRRELPAASNPTANGDPKASLLHGLGAPADSSTDREAA